MMKKKPLYRDIAANKIPSLQILMNCLSEEEDTDDLDNSLVNFSIDDKNCL